MTDKQRERLVELLKTQHKADWLRKNGINVGDYEEESNEALLADFLLANGVIVPPCKVGQTVCRATKLVNGDEFVTEGIIFEVSSTYENGTTKTRFYFWAKGDEWESRHYSLWCDLTEFGKTVFLTKEEAEQALVTDTNVGSKMEGGVQG